MNTDKIADRIAKLLALAARAGTPEEAATAAAQAQALAERHGIDQARIDAANDCWSQGRPARSPRRSPSDRLRRSRPPT